MKTQCTKVYTALLTEGVFNEVWHLTCSLLQEYGFEGTISEDGCCLNVERTCPGDNDFRDFVIVVAKSLGSNIEYLWSISVEEDYEIRHD